MKNAIWVVLLLLSSWPIEVMADFLCVKTSQKVVKSTVNLSSAIVVKASCPKGYAKVLGAMANGAITGRLKKLPEACAPSIFGPRYDYDDSLRSIVTIRGTNFSASPDESGRFSIFNVKGGSYTLSVYGSGEATAITRTVEVRDGQSTDVGNIYERSTCCGNGVVEAGEACEGQFFDAQGYYVITTSGMVRNCTDAGGLKGEIKCDQCARVSCESY